MSSLDHDNLDRAIKALKQGDLIAYPTEAVWGLGCDPFNAKAVDKLLSLKGRTVDKGLIVVAANVDQCRLITQHLPPELRSRFQTHCERVEPTQRATTWVIPNNNAMPRWITGQFNTVAVRVSRHPIVVELCQAFDCMMVSTSANLSGQVAAQNRHQVEDTFLNRVQVYVDGSLGGQQQTSELRHLVTNEVLR
mgnify:FL=1